MSRVARSLMLLGAMPDTIRLTIPSALRYRSLAVRVVAEAARIVSGSRHAEEHDATAPAYDVRDPFDTAVVSAFMEILNNVAIHAYTRDSTGRVEIAITAGTRELVIELSDDGAPFDPDRVAELPEVSDASLPEGGMGLHIARAMLDDFSYQPGPPNRWRLAKRLPTKQRVRT